MDEPILLQKSKESREIAGLALKKRYFNSATNRTYYALYQMILHILDKNSINVRTLEGYGLEGSHDFTIKSLIKEVITEPEDKGVVNKIIWIKETRNNADYKDFHITEDIYSNKVHLLSKQVELVLEKYC